MKKLFLLFLSGASIFFLFTACNDPTLVGEELFEFDEADIRFTDTITIQAKTELVDRELVYSPENIRNSFLCGKLTSPGFGTASAGIYTQLAFDPAVPDPDFASALPGFVQLDSAVLILVYDTTGFFGHYNEEQTFEVFRLANPLDAQATYYSDQRFPIDQQLASSNPEPPISPSPDDLKGGRAYRIGSATVNPLVGLADTAFSAPQLRIRINPDLGEELLNAGQAAYSSFPVLRNIIKGLHIRGASDNDAMLAFSLNSAISGLRLYYRWEINDTTTLTDEYKFSFFNPTARLSAFRHDFSGSAVQNAAGSFAAGDSILYIQGMSGPNIVLEFPNIRNLEGVVVNKAELDLFAADDQEDLFPLGDRFLASKEDANGELLLIDDVTFALLRNNLDIFGGKVQLDEQRNIYKYSLNLSSHLQDMIDGKEPNRIILSIFRKREKANQTQLFGPGHSAYPLKLRVTYTTTN